MANLILSNVEILPSPYRNFSGKPSAYNAKGSRSFCIKISPEEAAKLAEDGWNVRCNEPQEEDRDPLYYLQVAVRYDNYPPKVWLVTEKKKVLLTEESIDSLDYERIVEADVVINPSRWEVNKKTGIKAYLATMYVTVLDEDPFADKYAYLD